MSIAAADGEFSHNLEQGEFSENFEIGGGDISGIFNNSAERRKGGQSTGNVGQVVRQPRILVQHLPAGTVKDTEIIIRGKTFFVTDYEEDETGGVLIWLR